MALLSDRRPALYFLLLAFLPLVLLWKVKLQGPAPTATRELLEVDAPGCKVSEFTASLQSSVISAAIPTTFECMARRIDTDKVTYHNYQHLYSKYLTLARLLPMHLLEIGIGCGMGYGPGNSFKLWREFVPRAAISYLEFDGPCVEPFRSAIEATGGRLHVGSQDDPVLLQSIVDAGQKYDVIIDDGRHHPMDQITSLRGLWPALKSGGVYIVEDIFTEYYPQFERDPKNGTLLAFLRGVADWVHCSSRIRQDGLFTQAQQRACEGLSGPESEVASFECMVGACAFIKRAA